MCMFVCMCLGLLDVVLAVVLCVSLNLCVCVCVCVCVCMCVCVCVFVFVFMNVYSSVCSLEVSHDLHNSRSPTLSFFCPFQGSRMSPYPEASCQCQMWKFCRMASRFAAAVPVTG